MEPLFEAKALYADQYVLYNIYRLGTEKYRAQLVTDEEGDYDPGAPKELVLSKNNRGWHIEDSSFKDLGNTLAIEIDVFNNGYGALLGRIGGQY